MFGRGFESLRLHKNNKALAAIAVGALLFLSTQCFENPRRGFELFLEREGVSGSGSGRNSCISCPDSYRDGCICCPDSYRDGCIRSSGDKPNNRLWTIDYGLWTIYYEP